MRHIILGTAGHIDHGKSSLVKALTGIDPDRLKEEKQRGITIDLGFADLYYPECDLSVGIVDVPGHERLVRNMLAGAGGIDIVLMVISADEGIMPQSREHLAICNLLGIRSGLIAITKSDLVEKEWLEMITDDVRGFVKGTFLEGSAIIPVSAKKGDNLDILKAGIRDLALAIKPKSADGLFRLPIDRVFTLKGFGTVITGTAISGKIYLDDAVEILPCNIKTKARGLHSHGRSISEASAGQRVAINLQSVEKDDLSRGDVVVTSSIFTPTKTVNVHLTLLEDVPALKSRSLVHFYSGTSETIARVVLFERDELKPLENCYCQLRLDDPVVIMAGDRYIVRRFSPLETLGGGLILDPSPLKRKRKDGLEDIIKLHTGDLQEKIGVKIEKAGKYGISSGTLSAWINADISDINSAFKGLISRGEVIQIDDMLIHAGSYKHLHDGIAALLKEFHLKNPIKPGLQKEEARTHFDVSQKLFNHIISNSDRLVAEKDLIRLKSFSVALSDGQEQLQSSIMVRLEKAKFQPPSKEDLISELKINSRQLTDILNLLSKSGRTVRINESLYLTKDSYDEIVSRLRDFFKSKGEISVAEFRDMLNTSRKYALPILEFLDSSGVTLRTGDVRKLIKPK